jgi:hypothetical protein
MSLTAFYTNVLRSPQVGADAITAAWTYASQTSDGALMARIASHAELPAAVLRAVAASTKAEVRVAYLERPDISAEVLAAVLAKESRATVLEAVASSPSCRPEMLAALASQRSLRVRMAVAAHPSVPDPTFREVISGIAAQWATMNYTQRSEMTKVVTGAERHHQWMLHNLPVGDLAIALLSRVAVTDADIAAVVRRLGTAGAGTLSGHELEVILAKATAGPQTCDAVDELMSATAAHSYWHKRVAAAVAAKRALYGDGPENGPETIIPTLTDPGELDRYLPDAHGVRRLAELLAANPHTSARTFLELAATELHGNEVISALWSRADRIELLPQVLTSSPVWTTLAVTELFDDPGDGVDLVLDKGPHSAIERLLDADLVDGSRVGNVPWMLVSTRRGDIVYHAQALIAERFADADAEVTGRRWSRFNALADAFHGSVEDLIAVCVTTA